jgi:GNAT superfamily N-acetyltransferase
MGVVVRPATNDEVDDISGFLHSHMSAKVSQEQWRRILDYPWRPRDVDLGRVAVDGDRIVGFLGLVYADRKVGSVTERFCNVCAWYLLRDYRGRGIGDNLLTDAVADPLVTYTNLTATLASAQAFCNRGFRVLDEDRLLFYPEPGESTVRVSLKHIEGLDTANEFLHTEAYRIWCDHRDFNVVHLVAQLGMKSCYLVFSVKRKGADLLYHEVLYASDHTFLAEHAQAISNGFLNSKDAVLAIDRRFLPMVSRTAKAETIRLVRLYRSTCLQPRHVDHLYSEIALLDLKLP